MAPKPIPEFGEMPLIPLFSQKIPLLKLIQVTKVFHITRFLVRCKASLWQIDVDFLMFRTLTVHWVDAKKENTCLMSLS